MNSRVAIVQRVLAHYRVPFFNRLRDLASDRGVDVELVTGRPSKWEESLHGSGELPWATQRRCVYLGTPIRHVVWQSGVRSLLSADLVVVEQASRLLQNYVLGLGRLVGKPAGLALWGHGRHRDQDAAWAPAERVKSRLTGRADWFFAYTAGVAAQVARTGFPVDRITVVQNAIDTAELARMRARLNEEDLAAQRSRLGLGIGPVGVALGSIYDLKRPEFLLSAAFEIRRRIPTFHLVVIGDGPMRKEVERLASGHQWIHVLGALHGAELVRTAAVGEVILNPGSIGLGVLDSFALGLPTITCAGVVHSPEFEYLESDRNGMVLPAGTTESEYADATVSLLNDGSRLASLRAGAMRSSEVFTIEAMAENFADGLAAACSYVLNRRRSGAAS